MQTHNREFGNRVWFLQILKTLVQFAKICRTELAGMMAMTLIKNVIYMYLHFF